MVASTAVGEPFRSRVWSWALPLDGSAAPERLPYGPCYAVSPGPGGAVVLGTDQRRAGATWKRYRGGTAGKLWIDPDGSGTFERLLGDNPASWRTRTGSATGSSFLSDHEGWGNVYSVRPDGTDLRRHTDHGDATPRALRTDGSRLV